MTAFLRNVQSIVVAGDAPGISNPRQKFVDWSRDISAVEVENPQSITKFLTPNTVETIFDGSRTLATDNLSTFDLYLVPNTIDRYRIKWVSGTNPVFRTDRSINLSGSTIDVIVYGNKTATFTISAGSFSGVQVGDTVWIPDTDEVGSQPFHAGNRGFWLVLAMTTSVLTVERLTEDFDAQAETNVAITLAGQFQAFSSDSVQVGDKVDIGGGFVAANRRTLPIMAVTSTFIEVESAVALIPESTVAPGAANFIVRTAGKRLVYLECDQELVVRVNGDTGSFQKVSPFVPGDARSPGHYSRAGSTWKLQVLNTSPRVSSVFIISME